MNEPIARFMLAHPDDIYALRQHARAAAQTLGCDESTQVRLATALSELGRDALERGATLDAAFVVGTDGALTVTIAGYPVHPAAAPAQAIAVARRLIDDVVVRAHGADATRSDIALTIRGAAARDGSSVAAAAVRDALSDRTSSVPLERLRLENQGLVAMLDLMTEQQRDLTLANAEMEETNRGVMALYAQLGTELAETHRGVVALYAELDDATMRATAESNAKRRLLASMSHELRVPLSAILGLSDLLTDPDAPDAERRTQIEMIARSCRALLGVVDALLDLTRADVGLLVPEIADVDICETLAAVRGAVRPLVRPETTLTVDVAPGVRVRTDPALFAHVVRNLVSNALKFTERGSIRVTAAIVADAELVVTVEDSGIGIPASEHERIFEEFSLVPGPQQIGQRGPGLGLATASRIANALGGSLSLTSTVGVGSTFTLRLPVRWDALVQTALPLVRDDDAPHFGCILIVDDDAAFRAELHALLTAVADRVVEAGGGAEGLALMRSARPDVAFVDLVMPEYDGAAVIAEAAGDPELSAVPLVLLTSSDLTEVAVRAGGAAALLAKSTLTPASVRRALQEAGRR